VYEDQAEMLKNYRELKVWQKSYSLCLDIYRLTRIFPKEERYGSVCELETQILLSGDLNYIKIEKLEEIKGGISEVERMLKALITSLENKHLTP